MPSFPVCMSRRRQAGNRGGWKLLGAGKASIRRSFSEHGDRRGARCKSVVGWACRAVDWPEGDAGGPALRGRKVAAYGLRRDSRASRVLSLSPPFDRPKHPAGAVPLVWREWGQFFEAEVPALE